MNDHKCKIPPETPRGIWECPICKKLFNITWVMHPTGHSVDKNVKSKYKTKRLW